MSIDSLDGQRIPEIRQSHPFLQLEQEHEREEWNEVMPEYSSASVLNAEGIRFTLDLQTFDRPPYQPIHSIKPISDEVLYIEMTDFESTDDLLRMMEEGEDWLCDYKKWIVDVRVNNGGNDTSFYPLLPYLFHEEGVDLYDGEEMWFQCTEVNADRQIKQFEEELKTTNDNETRRILTYINQLWKEHRGEGLVPFDFSSLFESTVITGMPIPSKVVLLADVTCGSSGDTFVDYAKRSKKVTVMGRATKGLNDYANLASVEWEEGFEFHYPTSRLRRIDEGRGMTGIGILPHIHIPWTPLHIDHDIDLERAMDYLKG
ncbi:hypothetical protein N781_16410 [Pontibacillus halophilus JSM 076056 = DSM 19796]|uniref:Tail specific protease domain-containing protein n=1 Tax=Pontibacillus halophilus JSM 076056 = DSM 19796 TaxID=1385510 RepID=A0A0A5GJZ8_9BACI|nr:S41 family peptidase [Pontibacillus halophilus]KGX92339.1 hypothetical protein N781_16410 [Pontibacillus halophilus JSM 076056 = DSM 19796]